MALPATFHLRTASGLLPIPSVGFGTWASDGTAPTSPAKPEWVIKALSHALDAGYRHFDTAWFYGVDQEIGTAIREHEMARSELFITSKIWPNFYAPETVEWCCDKILAGMQLDYLDCLLLHWPCAFEPSNIEELRAADASQQASMAQKAMKEENGQPVIDWKHCSMPIAQAAGKQGDILPTWNAMKELVRKGKVKSIGVSNFSIKDLETILPSNDVPVSINQVEAHPWFPNNELLMFHNKHGILTSCFSPFAGQKADGATLIKDPTVVRLAEKNGMGVGQLLQSWAVQRGTIPLGKSADPGRMKANFSVMELSKKDVQALNELEIPEDKGRTIDWTDGWGVKLWQN